MGQQQQQYQYQFLSKVSSQIRLKTKDIFKRSKRRRYKVTAAWKEKWHSCSVNNTIVARTLTCYLNFGFLSRLLLWDNFHPSKISYRIYKFKNYSRSHYTNIQIFIAHSEYIDAMYGWKSSQIEVSRLPTHQTYHAAEKSPDASPS